MHFAIYILYHCALAVDLVTPTPQQTGNQGSNRGEKPIALSSSVTGGAKEEEISSKSR